MKFNKKLRMIRLSNNQSQQKFADTIGISRANLSGLELDKIKPAKLLINCISLTYNVSKTWLTDDNDDDISPLNGSNNMGSIIKTGYEKLDDNYKLFVREQIDKLFELQEKEKEKYINGLDNGD